MRLESESGIRGGRESRGGFCSGFCESQIGLRWRRVRGGAGGIRGRRFNERSSRFGRNGERVPVLEERESDF